MTEFITRCCHAEERYEVIIKTDSKEHYEEAEQFARRLIGHEKPVTITNADRIRTMTDEELAKLLLKAPLCRAESRVACRSTKSCLECLMEWLQQPEEEGEEDGK